MEEKIEYDFALYALVINESGRLCVQLNDGSYRNLKVDKSGYIYLEEVE